LTRAAPFHDPFDHEYMIPALEAVCDLLNDSAEELERIATACENL